MGPGRWFEVAGDAAAFTNQVKTLNGDMIDMETYGLASGIGWTRSGSRSARPGCSGGSGDRCSFLATRWFSPARRKR
jgi:hypothetical protein